MRGSLLKLEMESPSRLSIGNLGSGADCAGSNVEGRKGQKSELVVGEQRVSYGEKFCNATRKAPSRCPE